MKYQNLLIEVEDDILMISINRPKALNALNNQTFEELKDLFSQDFSKYFGVIITGAGEKSFVAGADIKEFLSLNEYTASELSRRGQLVFHMIENTPIPVIAAVNGFALGGGCELAMACHIRIASEEASFGQPEAKLGIIPGYGATQRLPQLVGKGKAMELLLTGRMVSAEEALQIRLVEQVVKKEDLLATAKNLIKKISKNSPTAVAASIRTILAGYTSGVDGYRVEVNEFGKSAGQEDFKEGASAFIEKRKPNFRKNN